MDLTDRKILYELDQDSRQSYSSIAKSLKTSPQVVKYRVENLYKSGILQYCTDPLVSRVTFMRPQHIPKLVELGTYDIGICGADCIHESEAVVATLAELPYGRGDSTGRAQVVLVSSRDNPVTAIQKIAPGSRILSEYPNITREVFREHGISVEIEFSYGGTEAHIPRDYPLGVCLADTGASLEANGLKIVEVLLKTSTVLIANKSSPSKRAGSINALKHFLVGTLEARERVFVTMNVSAGKKNAVLRVLPALKKPTITRLAGGRYFSVGTVVNIKEKNQVITNALRAGAEGLLVQPISQIVEKW